MACAFAVFFLASFAISVAAPLDKGQGALEVTPGRAVRVGCLVGNCPLFNLFLVSFPPLARLVSLVLFRCRLSRWHHRITLLQEPAGCKLAQSQSQSLCHLNGHLRARLHSVVNWHRVRVRVRAGGPGASRASQIGTESESGQVSPDRAFARRKR
jgi:hypothetical protein